MVYNLSYLGIFQTCPLNPNSSCNCIADQPATTCACYNPCLSGDC